MTQRYTPSAARRAFTAITLGVAFQLSACHQAPPPDDAKSADAKATQPADAKAEDAKVEDAKADGEGVTLTMEQVDKLGIVTDSAKAADYTAETSGYGVVVPHDTIAAAVAELTTAELTEKQTHAALARAQSLKGTPGALSAEVEETAGRQSAADAAAQVLAAQRLSAIIGLNPAWKAAENTPMLQELASGKSKLLRATFPLGTIHGQAPKTLRAAHLDAIQSTSPQAALGSKLTSVWNAPADVSIPGRSFFALLKGDDFAEGERLLVWAPGTGPAQAGVLVPASALVISNGKSWCYIEKQPGKYRRVEVNTERPFNDGYVVTEGVPVGAKMVTSAAGLLLARESNSDTDAD
jgi:hypothetical protein